MKKFIAIALVFILAVAFPITALADEPTHYGPGFPDSDIEDTTITDSVDPDNVVVEDVWLNDLQRPVQPEWDDFFPDRELDDDEWNDAWDKWNDAWDKWSDAWGQWWLTAGHVSYPDFTFTQKTPEEAQEFINNFLIPYVLNEAWAEGMLPEDLAALEALDVANNAIWDALDAGQITPEEAQARWEALSEQRNALWDQIVYISVGTIDQITQIGRIQLDLDGVEVGGSSAWISFQLDGVDPWDIVWVAQWMDAAGEFYDLLIQAEWNSEAQSWKVWVHDIHLLSLFFALIERGVPPAEAARTVLSETTGTSPTTYDHGTNAGFILLGVLLFGAVGVFAAKKARQYN